jgi:rubrerythrin
MSAPEQASARSTLIANVEDLLAHARTMEAEAAERYDDLADQMEVHNNHEVARLFRKLAEIEAKHIAAVEAMGDGSTPGITRARRRPRSTRCTT